MKQDPHNTWIVDVVVGEGSDILISFLKTLEKIDFVKSIKVEELKDLNKRRLYLEWSNSEEV